MGRGQSVCPAGSQRERKNGVKEGGRPRVAEGLCEETLNNFASLKGKCRFQNKKKKTVLETLN